MHLLQQAEPFPDNPGGDRLAGWLSAQHLASLFADASTERIVPEADLRLRFVAVPRLADDFPQAMFAIVALVPAGVAVILLYGAAVNAIPPANAVQLRQAVMRDLLSRSFERVTGRIPEVGPAARRRVLAIACKNVTAMQSTKTIVFAAGGQQPQGLFAACILTTY
ncbi:hypothetical protein L2X67_22400 [Enterobacter ludwigii]|nr:hypothetical protein [Enterobacter ludwigii]